MPTSYCLTDGQLEEIQRRYPEQKPICLNYAHCRQDIFALLAMVRELRELCERRADAMPPGDIGGADHV